MYSTDRDRPPKRPVITSLAGALSEVRRWQAENQLDKVKDGDGLAWDMAVKVGQIPDPADPRKVLWQIRILLTAAAAAADLVATGALDGAKDARLIAMIGDRTVPLAMRPAVYQAATEEAVRALLVDLLPQLKASVFKSSLADVKRSLVGRWVDEACRFGGEKSS